MESFISIFRKNFCNSLSSSPSSLSMQSMHDVCIEKVYFLFLDCVIRKALLKTSFFSLSNNCNWRLSKRRKVFQTKKPWSFVDFLHRCMDLDSAARFCLSLNSLSEENIKSFVKLLRKSFRRTIMSFVDYLWHKSFRRWMSFISKVDTFCEEIVETRQKSWISITSLEFHQNVVLMLWRWIFWNQKVMPSSEFWKSDCKPYQIVLKQVFRIIVTDVFRREEKSFNPRNPGLSLPFCTGVWIWLVQQGFVFR